MQLDVVIVKILHLREPMSSGLSATGRSHKRLREQEVVDLDLSARFEETEPSILLALSLSPSRLFSHVLFSCSVSRINMPHKVLHVAKIQTLQAK